jgi:hypothetical protein
MRILGTQSDGRVRAAVLVAVCVALTAMTSGLLLAIHLADAEHHEDHDSHHCRLCQQLLLVAKEFLAISAAPIVSATQVLRVERPAPVRIHHGRPLEVPQPRGPPASSLLQRA